MKIVILALAIGFGDCAFAVPKATCAIFEVKDGNPINDTQSGYNAEPYQPLTLKTTDNFFTSRVTRQDDEFHGISVNLKAGTVSTAAFFPDPLSNTTLTLIVEGRKGQVICTFK